MQQVASNNIYSLKEDIGEFENRDYLTENRLSSTNTIVHIEFHFIVYRMAFRCIVPHDGISIYF